MIFLTEIETGDKNLKLCGPNIEADSFQEAEEKAREYIPRLVVLGILDQEIEVDF